MAGTIRGRIESLVNEADEHLNAGVIFKNVYDVLSSHPNTTLISLGYGGGTGTDYPDGANPFGDNAHFVFRFDSAATPWYLFCTVGGISSAVAASNVQVDGSTPFSSNATVCVSAAVGIGGDENPWNGTESADGTDTKPTQLWADPGGGGTNVQVVPASNSDSGSDGSNKNNCLGLYGESSPGQTVRYQIVCDDDTIAFIWDERDNGTWEYTVLGTLDDSPHLASYDKPLFGFTDTAPPAMNSSLGVDYSGATHPDDTVLTWQGLEIEPLQNTSLHNADYYPDDFGARYPLFPLCFGSVTTGNQGYLGETSFVRVGYSIPSGDTDTALEFAAFGTLTTNQVVYLFPWDGATTPGTGTTRAGVDFTRVP